MGLRAYQRDVLNTLFESFFLVMNSKKLLKSVFGMVPRQTKFRCWEQVSR